MEYPELSKLFHMDTSSDRYSKNEAEATRRKKMESTFIVEMLSDSESFFIAVPREMIVLIEKILRAERKTSAMMRTIPPIGQAALVRGLVLDEVVSTNTIEGIHSTRRQIEEALESRETDDTSFKRFKELALLYLHLAEKDQPSVPETLKEIREIYDAIMEGELKESDKPDGELFRKKGVDITSNGIKTIHHGIEPESKIFEGLNNMLKLTARNDMPELISSLASHYLFECIHPFYDGNGRTNRFISSYLLSKELEPLISYHLAKTIKQNISKYYKSFDYTNDTDNRGDLTGFITNFLEIILASIEALIDSLEDKIERLHYFEQILLSNFKDKTDYGILHLLLQNSLFGLEPLSAREMAEMLDKSYVTINNRLKKDSIKTLLRSDIPHKYDLDLDILKTL